MSLAEAVHVLGKDIKHFLHVKRIMSVVIYQIFPNYPNIYNPNIKPGMAYWMIDNIKMAWDSQEEFAVYIIMYTECFVENRFMS